MTLPNSEAGGNIGDAVDFLCSVATGGRVAVVAIVPDGALDAAVFDTAAEREQLACWLDARHDRANLYFSLNEPHPDAVGRLKEVTVERIRGLAVDLDPRAAEEAQDGGLLRERARLAALAERWRHDVFAPPTAIVDSGSGVQAIWLFPEPLPNTEANRAAVKAQAKGLGELLGSDRVQSLDHLFRIPGTRNLPDARKRAKGRGPTATRLVHYDPRALTPLAGLAVIAAPAEDRARDRSAVQVEGFDYNVVIAAAEDPASLPAELAAALDAVKSSPQGRGALENSADRSGRDFALACACVEHGITDPTAVGQITFALSAEKIREKDGQGYGGTYAASTIRRALERTKPQPTTDDWFDGKPAAVANLPAPLPTFRMIRGLIDPKALPVRDWIINPLLPAGAVHQLIGEPGAGKSTLLVLLAIAVAAERQDILRGADAYGRAVARQELHKPGAVILYNVDDTESEMERRLVAAQRQYGVTDEEMQRHGILVRSGAEGAPLKILERVRAGGPLQVADGLKTLEDAIVANGIVLAVLDHQVSLAPGMDENSNSDMDQLMGELARLAGRTGACIALAHHSTKMKRDAAGDMGAGRGASAAAGRARSIWTLTRVTGTRDDEKGLGDLKGLVRLDDAKASYADTSEPIIFRRHSVAVGNGRGIGSSDAAGLYSLAPRERLLAEGDRAPVLQIVDHRALTAAAEASARVKDATKAEAIARVADELLGDEERVPLTDIFDVMAERLRTAKIVTAASPNKVLDGITSALAGEGVRLLRGGQLVHIRAAKLHAHRSAKWWIVRTAEQSGIQK